MVNFKEVFLKSKWLMIFYYIFDNCKNFLFFKAGNFTTSRDSILNKLNLTNSIEYINRVFNDYIYYSSSYITEIRGERILEIGTGDNFGVALKFIAEGASQVVCLDKFIINRNIEKEKKLYKNLSQKLNTKKKFAFFRAIKLNNLIKLNSSKLKYVFGKGIEESLNFFKRNSFNFIISRAVMEHIYKIDKAFEVMDQLLVKGGIMMHKIDFSDHKMFSEMGKHPLTFLTIPSFVYKLMTNFSSKPNRKLINYYLRKMNELEYESKVLITSILGEKEELVPYIEINKFNFKNYKKTIKIIEEIRPKLKNEFKNISNEHLMITGIFLIAKKKKNSSYPEI
ncbi:MAG: methyltransferase domain-containing protein [Candidatus Hermodarchaeota archaeon]